MFSYFLVLVSHTREFIVNVETKLRQKQGFHNRAIDVFGLASSKVESIFKIECVGIFAEQRRAYIEEFLKTEDVPRLED